MTNALPRRCMLRSHGISTVCRDTLRQNLVRVEDAVRIKHPFDLPHQLYSFR